jgi:hypothetical protein
MGGRGGLKYAWGREGAIERRVGERATATDMVFGGQL